MPLNRQANDVIGFLVNAMHKHHFSTAALGTPPPLNNEARVKRSLLSAPTTTADVRNLFLHAGDSKNIALAYQEIRSDSAAQSALSHWPMLSEWLDLMPTERDL